MGKISTIMRLDYVINQLSVYNYQYKLRWYRGHISSSFVIQDELFIYKEDIMVELAKMILEFLIVYLIVYVCYYFFSYKKIGKYNRNKQPANIKYLTLR